MINKIRDPQASLVSQPAPGEMLRPMLQRSAAPLRSANGALAPLHPCPVNSPVLYADRRILTMANPFAHPTYQQGLLA
jgi:hypothetical protein